MIDKDSKKLYEYKNLPHLLPVQQPLFEFVSPV